MFAMTNPEIRDAEGIREFHIGDILTVTTGALLSPRHVEGVYDILNYMTGDNLYIHALPRAIEECGPELLRQYPDLERVEVPEFNNEKHVWSLLGELVVEYGETRLVLPLHPDDHTVIDPTEELHLMGHGDKVVTFEILNESEE